MGAVEKVVWIIKHLSHFCLRFCSSVNTCKNLLAVKMRNILILFVALVGFSESLSVFETDSGNTEVTTCYSCFSVKEEECDESNAGAEKKCEPGHGCKINIDIPSGGVYTYTRDCDDQPDREDTCTEEGTSEGGTSKACYCSTDLCNKNMVEAGSTETPDGQTSTTAPKEPFKCYKCNSNLGGGCSDADSGSGYEVHCPENYGCLISKDVSEGVNDFFIRDCLAVAEHDYKCDTVDTPEGVVHNCKCSTELCNINFVEAGSTEQPDGPTDAPTEPADKTVKCYSCDSNSDGCDDENHGTEIDCEVERGCTIMKNKDLYTRGCSVDEKAGCTEEADTRSCNCLTALCNENWVTAGAEDKIKCYSCDSNDSDCDDTHAGTETDCAVEAGCAISTDVSDGKTVFVRGCSGELEPTPGCTNEANGATCICMDTLCNFDWTTAGLTTASSDTTKPTETSPTKETTPSAKTTPSAETTAPTAAPGAANRKSFTLAIALGVGAAFVLSTL